MSRCRNAIALGWHPGVPTPPESTPGIHVRCMKEDDLHTEHGGHGLAQFEYQTVEWFGGDRRTYQTDRPDVRAWKIPGELTVTPEEKAEGDRMLRQFADQLGIDPSRLGL